MDNGGEYFVESIVEKRVRFGKVEYLLKWKGFTEYAYFKIYIENISNKFDVVLVDTAGRMQNNEPLMRSLAKVNSL